MIKFRSTAFADPNESLPYNINTVATIPTDEESIYSKMYPYPQGVSDFVNKEVKQLLADGIIRPSTSPYNNPIWVVDKKGVDKDGHKNKRLVIDFRKLNKKSDNTAFVDEHNATVVYTPGKQNQVADALSRQNVNALEDSGDSDAATIHSEESLTYTIETTDRPINCFANQIVIEESLHPATKNYVLFQNKMRHIIQFRDNDSLLHLLRDVVKPEVVNAIHCELPVLAFIQHALIQEFPSTVFRYS
ncbi:hypothetical protein KR084_006494, partial [Drosophila pseudotakahashii]